tara:strand:+ start:691 stop:1002 length:312 start_codon:yes stop_codon:yes gene_type:complete
MIDPNTMPSTTPSQKRRFGTISLLLGLGVALGTLTGCPSEDSGPLESVGETLDEAAEDTKSAIEDAFDDDGPMEKGGEALDKAGENLGDTVDEAKEDLKDATE